MRRTLLAVRWTSDLSSAVTDSTPGSVALIPLPGLPEVVTGDDLGELIVGAAQRASIELLDGDILCVTSKIVSKADGLVARASDAHERQALVRRESTHVVSERATSAGFTRVVAALAGPVMAGAGIDASNTGDAELLLLPRDPDASAKAVQQQVISALGSPRQIGVVLTDTAGRPWRAGLVDLALGLHGIRALDDLRGQQDTEGRDLAVTVRCLADEIASAADLVKGKIDRVPVAIVRGLANLVVPEGHSAKSLVRNGPDDWFALGRAEAVREALGIVPGSPESENIGIESVYPETVHGRLQRAVRAALPGCPGVGASSGAPADEMDVDLMSADPIQLGRAWARLEVALAGERLDVIAEKPRPSTEFGHVITLHVAAQDPHHQA